MQSGVHFGLDLADDWVRFRARRPGAPVSEAARALGVSEAELLATGCGSAAVTRLRGGWIELIRGLQDLGPVVLETARAGVTMSAHGVAVPVEWAGRRVSLRVGPSRLRYALDHWYHGFAVREDHGTAIHHALYFCDADGAFVHRVELGPDAAADVYARLVQRFTHPDQSPFQAVGRTRPATGLPDAAVDVRGLRAAWDALRDPHDFATMLARLGIGRAQAARLAGGDRARRIAPETLANALRRAAAGMVPLSVMVENAGVQQTYGGHLRRVEQQNGVLTAVEPGLRLSIVPVAIASAWLVRRPSTRGDVTSLQYFDAADRPVAILCGHDAADEASEARWSRLVAAVLA